MTDDPKRKGTSRKKAGRKPSNETPLSERERLFCYHYVQQYPDHNAAAAAKLAGYKGKENNIRITAHRLMHRPKVAATIEHMLRRVMAKAAAKARTEELSLVRLITEDLALATSQVTDVAEVTQGAIAIFDSHDWSPAAKAAVKSISMGPFGLKVTMHDKIAPLGRLQEYLLGPGRQADQGEQQQIYVYELPAKRALEFGPRTPLTPSPAAAAAVELELPTKRTNGHVAPVEPQQPDPDDELQ